MSILVYFEIQDYLIGHLIGLLVLFIKNVKIGNILLDHVA